VRSSFQSFVRICWLTRPALVTRAESQNESGLKPAAALAAQGELHDVTESLWEAVGDDRVQLLEKVENPPSLTIDLERTLTQFPNQETTLLVQYTNETAIQPYDLISDPKNVVALSLLYNSLVSSPPILLKPY
jgi:exocyst complex component 4